MWKPPAPGACSLYSLAVTCLSSTRKTEPVGLCSSHVSFWDKLLSLKKDLLPSECQDKKTFSDFPCKLQTPISTQDLRRSLTSCQPLGWWQAHVTAIGCAISFMSLGFDKNLLQPVPLQHTERKIKEQYQTRSWVRLATIILREGPQTVFLHRCPTVAVMVNWDNPCRPHRTGPGLQERLLNASNVILC